MKSENSCRICGAGEFRLACAIDGFQYVTCSSCDVTRQYPYPTEKEMQALYDQYLEIKNRQDALYMSDEYWLEYKRIKDLTFADLGYQPAELKGKKVLDIGCATGQFVQYAGSYEADAYGIDVSQVLIDVARKKGLNCACKNLFDVTGEFDFIHLSHVIEHVDFPLRYLQHIHRCLGKAGYLSLETPCTGIVSESFGKDWRFYMPTEHIHLFSQKSLFKIAASEGFSVRSWIRFGSGNTSGTIPSVNKKVADTIAKKLGIGDTIAILFQKQ